MSDVITGHCQNWHLGDRAFTTVKSSSSFVDCTQIGIHVSWISSASRYFFSGCRNFSESFCIVCHVGEYDEDVGSELDREILSGCQRESWRKDSFDGWIVCEVDEHGYVVECPLFFEVVSEEAGFIGRDAHGGEDCCERFVCASDLGLTSDLGRDLVVWKSGRGE